MCPTPRACAGHKACPTPCDLERVAFARRHHFHRAGDLLSALYARDLGADFLANCHAVLPGLRRLESFDG